MFKYTIQKLISVNVVQLRFYPRWTHRKPLKVLSPEEYKTQELDYTKETKTVNQDNKIKWKHSTESKHDVGNNSDLKIIDLDELDFKSNVNKHKPKIKKPLAKKTVTDMLETIIDANGEIIYTKMQNNDPRVGSLLTTVKSKKEKQKKDLILLEGKRLIKDALTTGCRMKYLIFSRKNEIEYLKPYLPKSGGNIYKMPYREIQMWSDLTTSPGIMGIFNTPDLTSFKAEYSIPLTVICDNIREPGNLGSILRICAGVGCEKVLLTKGCVNVWDSKVTRSAAGAHFKLQIHKQQEWSEIQKELENSPNIFIADNKILNETTEENANENKDLVNLFHSVPAVPYYSVNYTESPNVLIIGGETEGISLESYQFAAEYNGIRLNIPLLNDVESLNTATALGIIAFEMKKKMIVESINTKTEIKMN